MYVLLFLFFLRFLPYRRLDNIVAILALEVAESGKVNCSRTILSTSLTKSAAIYRHFSFRRFVTM